MAWQKNENLVCVLQQYMKWNDIMPPEFAMEMLNFN